MNRVACAAVFLCATAAPTINAQWTIQDSHTTADLRGIHSIANGVAWASGTEGTVLRTTNDGKDWQRCATPPDGEHLDFRGIQAFDADTAIVMSSGKGPLSRLYKTTDGCRTWKLVFTNPDSDGFWDAVILNRFDKDGYLLGDPVDGRFRYWETDNQGTSWRDTWESADRKPVPWDGLEALPNESAFAASNSALLIDERYAVGFVTGGPEGARLILGDDVDAGFRFHPVRLPLRSGTATTGAYSIESRDYDGLVVVGGDYVKPNDSGGTAAYSTDGGEHWKACKTPPHGYRSAVAYDEHHKTWVTVGPNGTDVSTDDGRNWRPLRPGPGDPPDADQHWNALSLPFVVGPHGRIGKLEAQALAH